MNKRNSNQSGVCHLCLNTEKLCRSHAIPHSFFKTIHRKNNGQARLLTDDDKAIRKTNNSGDDRLFCEKCDNQLGNYFDGYAYNWFLKARLHIDGIDQQSLFEIDSTRMAHFIASMFWRCSISQNEMYANLETNYSERMLLKQALFANNPFKIANFSIANLIDNKGFLNAKALSDIVFPPTRFYTSIKLTKHNGMFICINGFIVCMIFPLITSTAKMSIQNMKAGQNKILVHDFNIREFPPFMAIYNATTLKMNPTKS